MAISVVYELVKRYGYMHIYWFIILSMMLSVLIATFTWFAFEKHFLKLKKLI